MTTFEISPYEAAGAFRFGMSEAEVLATGNVPLRTTKNRRGEQNWLYDGFSVRFGSGDGLLREIGFSRSCNVVVKGVAVFSDPDALGKILIQDANVFEFYGFLVFFGIGITLTGFHDGNESEKALTAFVRGHWDGMRSNPSFRKWSPSGLGEPKDVGEPKDLGS